jgi:hypothetical protein
VDGEIVSVRTRTARTRNARRVLRLLQVEFMGTKINGKACDHTGYNGCIVRHGAMGIEGIVPELRCAAGLRAVLVRVRAPTHTLQHESAVFTLCQRRKHCRVLKAWWLTLRKNMERP